jgi:hypothetical protein
MYNKMNKTVVKNKPSGYSASQGGIYAPVGYDPLNINVSLPVSTQKLSGNGHMMKGYGLGADILSGVVGTAGGIFSAAYSAGNPYAISIGSTVGSALGKSVGELIGLGVIPQKFIDFVDRLISNGKTMSQIKSSIMKFELSPELKAKLSRAVSSLLRSMSGEGMMKTKVVSGDRKRKKRMMTGGASDPMSLTKPNASNYGIVKFK